MKLFLKVFVILLLCSTPVVAEDPKVSIRTVEIGTVGVTTDMQASCTLTTGYVMNSEDGYKHMVKYPKQVIITISCEDKEGGE